MDRKAILFTAPGVAELQELPAFTVQHPQDVLVRMEYTVVSGGTERANLMGLPNTPEAYPKALGYCGVGRVLEIGDQVTKVAVGDRVLVYHGFHSTLNCRRENEITKVYQEDMDSLDASLVIIASMGLGGVRKLELELGESAMVMGLGLLGMSAVQFCRLSGAYPLIAVDLNPTRRQLALELGADYALDPADPDFVRQVKEITGGKGVNACVEVTGVSAAMHQALECAATQGRISLLGCTRISDCSVDYYQLVHKPGVKLIGATAHYVTADLDEGPIIAQSVQPVTHAQTTADFVSRGRDVEGDTLVQAVRWHAQHRVLLDGRRTVVFG